MRYYEKVVSFFSVFLMLSYWMALKGQEVSTLQFMRMNPYRSTLNPAKVVPYKGYVAVPVLGNFGVELRNSGLKLNKLLNVSVEGDDQLEVRDFVKSLNDRDNWIDFSVQAELLGFGIRVKENFLSFSYQVNIHSFNHFSPDLFGFFIEGNRAYLGQENPAEMQLKLNTSVYHSLSVGFQRNIFDGLSIAVRPKLLFGLLNVKTNRMESTVITDKDDLDVTIFYNVDGRLSSVVPISFKESSLLGSMEASDAFTPSFKNVGIGIDLGAEFHINDRVGVAASLSDLGYIAWSSNNMEVTGSVSDQGQYYDQGSFHLTGLSDEQLHNIVNDPVYREKFLDTVKQYFPINEKKIGKYRTSLNTGFNVEGFVNLGLMHRFTTMIKGIYANDQIYPSLTLAYDGNFFDVLDVCVHYTLMKQCYLNLGLGIGVKAGPAHLFVSSNNILGFMPPLDGQNMQFQFGLLFTLGKYKM